MLKCDRLRDGAVVEKHGNAASGWQAHLVRCGGVNAAAIHVSPQPSSPAADALGLVGRQNREADSKLRHDIECFEIDCGFGEPHPFRRSSETKLKIADAP